MTIRLATPGMTSAARGPNSSASRPITGAPIGVVPKDRHVQRHDPAAVIVVGARLQARVRPGHHRQGRGPVSNEGGREGGY